MPLCVYAKAYVLLALPCVVASALFVPPNQVPDEMTHLLRAAQLAGGSMQGERFDDHSAGGLVDAGVAAFVAQHADWTVPPRRGPVQRFTGAQVRAHFPNTVRYPPMLYAPCVLALGASQWLGCSVETAFYAARLLNGLVAVGLTAWALALAQRGRGFLLALGLMPMALFEMGSVCQDAGMVGLAMLLAALMTRLSSAPQRPPVPGADAEPAANAGAYWTFAALVAMLAGARPPLLAFVLLAALQGWRAVPRWHRWAAPALCTASVIAWSAFTAGLQVSMRPGVPSSIMPQLRLLLHAPSAVGDILFNTFIHPDTNWLKTFVGVLGWLTVHLSASAYLAAGAALTLGAAFCVREATPLSWRDRGLAALAAGVAFAGMLATTYLTWTPLGVLRVEGIQGRYFYNFLPLVVVMLPSLPPGPAGPWLPRRSSQALLAACLLWLLQDAAGTVARAWSSHGAWPQVSVSRAP